MTDEVTTKPGEKARANEQPFPLSAGSLLDGRFLIERVLGAGGMGYVVLARHVELEERVAIKLLLPGRSDEDSRHRLVREARAAVKIKSEHVVRILDVVSTGPNAPYIVMEYLEGEDLASRIDGGDPLDVTQAVEIVLQACEVVGEAHFRGMAHRDIKPSNLFLVHKPGQAGFVKVLDFGITKTLDGGSERLTASNALLGSPAYAAPEQLRDSRSVDRRCDVWALGVVLYECLTGEIPFSGSSIAEVTTRILTEPPAPPPAGRPPLPEALLGIIHRCLEKEPGLRYDNLAELASALREFAPSAADKALRFLSSLGPSLPVLPKEPRSKAAGGTRLAGAMARTETALTAQGQTFDTRPDARRRPVALAIVAFAVATGAATYIAVQRAQTAARVSSEPPVSAVALPPAAPPHEDASPAVPSAEPSVTVNLEPIPTPSVAAAASASAPSVPARKAAPKPAARRQKAATPGAPWVDSR